MRTCVSLALVPLPLLPGQSTDARSETISNLQTTEEVEAAKKAGQPTEEPVRPAAPREPQVWHTMRGRLIIVFCLALNRC